MKLIWYLLKYLRFWGGSYRCIVCNRSIRKFFPFSSELQKAAKDNGFQYDFRRMETLNVDNCNCPFCLSSDRERFYLIFLEDYLKQRIKEKYSVLDFAPNAVFSEVMKSKPYLDYYSTDISRQDVDFRTDVCDMSGIMDGRFDIVICSHVLEHVSKPDDAMRELFRILQPNGIAIIMVPLFWDVSNTVEDDSHTTANERLKFYGQMDHVRLFAKHDFLGRLQKIGFVIKEVVPSMFDTEEIRKNAIAGNSILYVCTRS
jgi:O-antigen biosynthesis protein